MMALLRALPEAAAAQQVGIINTLGLELKVIDNEGGWGFACRVRNRDGSALDGLRIEAK